MRILRVADTEDPQGRKKKPRIYDYPLWQLEHIAQDILKDAIVKILSHDFDVNPQAVKRRLTNLGYHRKINLRLKD